ncbi:hypothetical protein CF392_05615 [Tamilnaduibacter salinus]|uniref:DUF1853 domain-containing protein n=1 Tax=Tamilnaduibacter salinus TaxID=1484056 RepID=A0A2A2I4B8_9GAMM|nr:DUF1853 family protein [Tamilnaduibacter salinus]PAV26507.1 hypothetical protein CF392_05615 [Tamilnaduibacter salinus]
MPESRQLPLTELRTDGVRHLAWLCHAPQLMTSSRQFQPSEWLPADTIERLRHWDRTASACPERLRQPANPRLGHYFERLYQTLLEDLLQWPILAQNRQVRQRGRTIGEMDFIVENRQTGEIEHHEIAVKFYLGYQHQDGAVFWYGPNAQDRLDRKTLHMLEQQSHLATRDEARDVLEDLGLTTPPQARIFMPGYLFYPDSMPLNPPSNIPPSHLRGEWLPARRALNTNVRYWVPLNKPHWLGPWLQEGPPDTQATRKALNHIAEGGPPRLFAELTPHPDGTTWLETHRFFVVPEHWPGPNARPT